MSFLPKYVNSGMCEYGQIWRVDLENQILRKSVSYIYIGLTSKLVKSIMPTFPCHFHGKIDHIDRFDSKSKFSINPKISVILKIDIPLRSVNMCQNGNPSRSGVRVGTPDKPMKLYLEYLDFKIFAQHLDEENIEISRAKYRGKI